MQKLKINSYSTLGRKSLLLNKSIIILKTRIVFYTYGKHFIYHMQLLHPTKLQPGGFWLAIILSYIATQLNLCKLSAFKCRFIHLPLIYICKDIYMTSFSLECYIASFWSKILNMKQFLQK